MIIFSRIRLSQMASFQALFCLFPIAIDISQLIYGIRTEIYYILSEQHIFK